jgi:hypothetical protein
MCETEPNRTETKRNETPFFSISVLLAFVPSLSWQLVVFHGLSQVKENTDNTEEAAFLLTLTSSVAFAAAEWKTSPE